MQAVNSDYILNGLETVKFVFCLQIYALADRTMNSKFSILHSASPRVVLKFLVHCTISACVYFVNKTLTAVSNPYTHTAPSFSAVRACYVLIFIGWKAENVRGSDYLRKQVDSVFSTRLTIYK